MPGVPVATLASPIPAVNLSPMSSPSIHLAEEALALPPELRVQLARLLIESLEGNSRTDAEIAGMLRLRLADLQNGKDTGLNFEQVFGEQA
jgi:hypothetical protein